MKSLIAVAALLVSSTAFAASIGQVECTATYGKDTGCTKVLDVGLMGTPAQAMMCKFDGVELIATVSARSPAPLSKDATYFEVEVIYDRTAIKIPAMKNPIALDIVRPNLKPLDFQCFIQ